MRRRALTSLGAAAVGLALVASQAHAGIQVESTGFNVADGTQNFEDAGCADGDVALGGGLEAYSQASDFVFLNFLGPVEGDPPRVWEGYADNITGGGSGVGVDVFVVCDTNAKPGDYKLREETRMIPDHSEKGLSSMCGPGEVVVGGGAFTTANHSDEGYVNSTGPIDGPDPGDRPDDGWTGVVNNDEDPGAATLKLTTSAVCDRKHNPSRVHYRTEAKRIADDSLKRRSVRCKDGERTIGGGIIAESSYKQGVYVNTTAPVAPSPPDGWAGWAENYDTPDDDAAKVKVTAICLG